MKKNLLILLPLVFNALAMNAQTNVASPYCLPPNNGVQIYYTKVSSGSITNTSGISANGYTYYDNVSPFPIATGLSSSFTISLGLVGTTTPLPYTVFSYIDFNHDNVFSVNEVVASQQLRYGTPTPFSTRPISDTVRYGETRIRFQVTENSNEDPCQTVSGQQYTGEVEDYRVFITGTKPIAVATGATNLSGSTAKLNGMVSANNPGSATVDFEYGQTTSYTNSISGGTVTGVGDNNLNVTINNLLPNTIYHYRIKSTNTIGTYHSPDKTFVTTSSGVGIGTTPLESIVIVPNPATNVISASGLKANRNYNVSIVDIAGKAVLNRTIIDGDAVNIETISAGTYFIKILNQGVVVHSSILTKK